MIRVLSVNYLLTLCCPPDLLFAFRFNLETCSLFCRAINGKEIIGFKLTIKLIVKILNRNEQTLFRITECYIKRNIFKIK